MLGVIVNAVGIGFGSFLFNYRIQYPKCAVQDVFSLFAFLFGFVGAQFRTFGLLGKSIGTIYVEVRDRPRHMFRKGHHAGADGGAAKWSSSR